MVNIKKYIKTLNKKILFFSVLFTIFLSPSSIVFASKVCGTGDSQVTTNIDLGCQTQGNAIMDMLFGIINFLSAGVGVVLIFSTVLAGIQWSAARDNPGSVEKAKSRLLSNLLALGLFIFAWALLNFLVPGGLLN